MASLNALILGRVVRAISVVNRWIYVSAIIVVLYVLISAVDMYGKSPRPIGLNGTEGDYPAILLSLRTVGDQVVHDTTTKVPLSLAELRAGYLDWRARIKSIRADCVGSFRAVDPNKVNDFGKQMELQMTYAEKGEKKYRTYEMPGSKSPDIVYAYDGNHFRQINEATRSGSISKMAQHSLTDLANILFETISISIGSEGEELEKSAFHIPTALSDQEHYRVLEHLQAVDGFPCHVVSSGPDTIWIDARNGFCVRRRVRFRTTSPDEPSVLGNIYIAKGFQERVMGVWLPVNTCRLDFATQEFPRNLWGKLMGPNSFHINWAVNNVSDELFETPFPAGLVIENLDDGTRFLAPAGEAL